MGKLLLEANQITAVGCAALSEVPLDAMPQPVQYTAAVHCCGVLQQQHITATH
jgi:hypothetical protein